MLLGRLMKLKLLVVDAKYAEQPGNERAVPFSSLGRPDRPSRTYR